MRVNLAGKKQDEYKSNQIQLQRRRKFWGESEYYLDLENDDKKWYKESRPSQTVNFWQIQMYP